MTDEVIPLIALPCPRKAKAVIWKDFGVSETDQLLALQNTDEIKSLLQCVLGIRESSSEKHVILLDMFYYAAQFCKNKSFNSEKTSCMLSIVKQTHEMATDTPYGNIKETLDFFKDLILCHSVHRPPFSLGIFSPQEASEISCYIIDTYFRHFKLYKYVFTPQVKLDLTVSYTRIPKTPQELDDEKKSNAEENLTTGRSDPEDAESVIKEEKSETPAPDEQPQEAEDDDPKAESMKELKRIIRERLTSEMQDLKTNFASQLKQSDEGLTKLVSGEGGDGGRKSARQSAKKKK